MKIFLKLLLLLVCLYYVPKFCYDKTAGFTIQNIHSSLSYNPEWEVENTPLPDIFNQPFTYLGTGGQCYAFASEDGKYVIKFFKHHLRRLPFCLKILPLRGAWKERVQRREERRFNKLLRDFRSYKLSMEKLPEETGLLYIHLNKTHTLCKSARIIDKLGIEHSIDLDQTEFILQKRASLAYTHLASLVEKGDLESAKSAIESICSLIISRSEKGIYDEDAKIHRNFGFVNNQAMLIDVGRLKADPSRLDRSVQYDDLTQITWRLDIFLQELDPSLSEYLHTCVEKRK